MRSNAKYHKFMYGLVNKEVISPKLRNILSLSANTDWMDCISEDIYSPPEVCTAAA